MPMPNRKTEVAAIAARYPQAFGPPDETVDARRRLLMPIICRELNKLDGGNWALINRLDRNDEDPKPGRLTSDALAWRPTREHVDVLSANGPMWDPLSVMPKGNDVWVMESPALWPSWDDIQPTPEPVPTPTPTPEPSPDVVALWARLRALEARIDRHLLP